MSKFKIARPSFPESYEVSPTHFLKWEQVSNMIDSATNYWLCTVSPQQHPHAVPVWGVWHKQTLVFDGSRQTRHIRNILENNNVIIHLESGTEVIIIKGVCEVIPHPPHDLTQPIAQGYAAKYTEQGYAPASNSWDRAGLFQVIPRQIVAWTDLVLNPTKFIFG